MGQRVQDADAAAPERRAQRRPDAEGHVRQRQLQHWRDPLRRNAGRSRDLALALALAGHLLFRFRDQSLDLLSTLVADLLVEIDAVFFFDDAAAFLADRLIEL